MRFLPWTALAILTTGCATTGSVDRVCMADRDCPEAPLPACVDRPESVDVATVYERQEEWVGEVVTLSGYLSIVGNVCTMLDCRSACCNQCTGSLVLTGAPSAHLHYPLPLYVDLGEGSSPWECSGDETGMCCPYPVSDNEVLVTGTLGDRAPNSGLGMSVDTLCTRPSP